MFNCFIQFTPPRVYKCNLFIIIKSDVSTFPTVFIFSLVVFEVVVPPNSVSFYVHLYISRKIWGFLSILTVQSTMPASPRIRKGMKVAFVCSHITLIIITLRTYLKALNVWKDWQLYYVKYVSAIKSTLSFIFFAIYEAVRFSLPMSLMIIVRICEIYRIIKSEV